MEDQSERDGPPSSVHDDSQRALLKCEALDTLLAPLGSSGRVGYTCLDISPNYFVFGANTGSLYFFDRKTLRFLRLISTVKEHITLVKWHLNENLLAVATAASEIFVLEINLADRYA